MNAAAKTITTNSNPWHSRIVGHAEVDPKVLTVNPLNWRIHPDEQRTVLRGSLDQLGWIQQVVVNRRTNNILDGHARVEEALARGEQTVPVLYVDLALEEEALALAVIDPISAMAEVEAAQLRELLGKLDPNDDLAGLLKDLEKQCAEIVAPEEFAEVDENLETEYCCPKCGYEWSGKQA